MIKVNYDFILVHYIIIIMSVVVCRMSIACRKLSIEWYLAIVLMKLNLNEQHGVGVG